MAASVLMRLNKFHTQPHQSKYTIVLIQEYDSVEAFEVHDSSEYITNFFKTYVKNDTTGIVEDWTCRLFSE